MSVPSRSVSTDQLDAVCDMNTGFTSLFCTVSVGVQCCQRLVSLVQSMLK